MRPGISLYWKCQLYGWTAFTLVALLFNELIYRDTAVFFPYAVSIFFFGLIFSHLLKQLINALHILEQRFSRQVIFLALITILFSLAGTYIWIRSMLFVGIWQLEVNGPPRTSSFTRAYFFNLFPVTLTLAGWVLIYFLYHYVQGVRRQEQMKLEHEKQLLELEARALRAQMNPHFIFNCLNSIKALIQTDEKQKAIDYLTTFSKLIRTLFQNSDKRHISLYDEIETCRLYMELEAMRFDGKIRCYVDIDPAADLKSVQVPALIIQPFIENAIWHGVIPLQEGGIVRLLVHAEDEGVVCKVDDNGIGREASLKRKGEGEKFHQSKGVLLSYARLELQEKLNQTGAGIDIIDKQEAGFAAGTTVIIHFNYQ